MSKTSWLRRCLEEIDPGIDCLIANRVIQKKIEKHQESLDAGATPGATNVKKDALEKLQEQANDRKLRIEEKARVIVGIVAIAFSVLLPVASFLLGKEGETLTGNWLTTLRSALSIGLGYFLVAGITALLALRADVWYEGGLEFEDDMEKSTDDGKKRDALGWRVRINDLLVYKRSNLAEISYRAIRNGIIAFAVASLIFLWLPKPPKDKASNLPDEKPRVEVQLPAKQ